MKIEEQLLKRSEKKCELCGSEDILSVYEVPPQTNNSMKNVFWYVGNVCRKLKRKKY